MEEEDHVLTPTGSEVNVRKNKSIDGDNRVVKRLLATKSTSTSTSKFMASAFKATRSNKSTDLVPQPQVSKVAQDASASASENASIAASVQISTEDDCDEELDVKKKKLTSWVWEHFTRYDVEVEQNDGSIVKQKWAKCKKMST